MGDFLTIGKVGELFVSMAFASALVSMVSFLMAERRYAGEKESWERLGQGSFGLHIVSILGIVVSLFYIIYSHSYEYHYAWSHSSNELPVYYMISCFWEGQEGSFLLWCFWHSILGGLLLFNKSEWRNGVLAIVASVELILASMLLGVFIFGEKLGSSPFTLLKDVFPDAEVYVTNPDFVPSNGNGLNPLLQNYWMVIHPPTLFLGFAATLMPFAYGMAGLIKGKYHEWIRPALPWMTFSVMILGIGIIMGGYWAYETLNFGGYWNWDPVENSSLVPWLCGVAALHAMLIYRKTKAYLKLTQILIVSTFLLVLYSTFLTRSGILGETSVHTFTDLGLGGQLIALVGIYTVAVIILFALRWKDIPARPDESKMWSAEFMLFLGILVFIFSSAIITFATSVPVFNAIFGTDIAPPPQVQLFYYKYTVWFGILFGVLSGIGQFLWWHKAMKVNPEKALLRPLLIAVFAAVAVKIRLTLLGWEFAFDGQFAEAINPAEGGSDGFLAMMNYYLMNAADDILLFASIFATLANLDVLIALLRKNSKTVKVMGGTIVHLGFGLMLLGMLFSSGYDDVLSVNLRPADFEGLPMEEQEKADNVFLPRLHANSIKGYKLTYMGKRKAKAPIDNLRVIEENAMYFKLRFEDVTGETWAVVERRAPFLKKDDHAHEEGDDHVHPTADGEGELEGEIDLEAVAKVLNSNLDAFNPQLINNRTQYGLYFENTRKSEDAFTLFPEAEVNEEMKSIIAHPSRRIYWDRDVYTYTSSLPDPRSLKPTFHTYEMRVGDRVELENIELILTQITNVTGQEGLEEYNLAAAAYIAAITDSDTLGAEPLFLLKGNMPSMKEDKIESLGLELSFVGVQPDKNLVTIQAKWVNPANDHITAKVIKKPMINLLWLGTFILTFGFLLSIFRRMKESRAGRKLA